MHLRSFSFAKIYSYKGSFLFFYSKYQNYKIDSILHFIMRNRVKFSKSHLPSLLYDKIWRKKLIGYSFPTFQILPESTENEHGISSRVIYTCSTVIVFFGSAISSSSLPESWFFVFLTLATIPSSVCCPVMYKSSSTLTNSKIINKRENIRIRPICTRKCM